MKLPPTPPVDALKFCSFVTASPTPFQAVSDLSSRLLASGFTSISERNFSQSTLSPGGRYFYTRNQSSLVAFTLPSQPSPRTAISFAVGHLDSPCLKVRPVSKRVKEGYIQVGVETYGGGLWHSWFDRDLSLAGRVIVSARDGKYTSRLVKIDRPLLRIPTIATHLDPTMNEAFKFNKETQYRPIIGLIADQLNGEKPSIPTPFSGQATPVEEDAGGVSDDVAGMKNRHEPMLLAVLADELGCDIGDIQDFELSLYDTQPSCVGGLSNEFIFSPRIDNLMTCFASIEAMREATTEQPNVNCVILFDNEEVGSISHHGAESNLLPSFVERIVSLDDFNHLGYHQILSNSFLLSADMGHAINPNYVDKYESNHAPKMNGGVVIKTNANQRYTSTAQTTFLLRQIAKKAGVPLQDFEARNDSSCGSTVGPHLSTHVRTVDIGLAQLSMHSIRETAGSADVRHYIDLFQGYFEHLAHFDSKLEIDQA